MPLYEYSCETCGRTEDAFRSIDERHNGPECHGPMKIVIGLAMGYVQKTFDPYVSPATGNVITSHAARRDDFKRSNCRPWEGIASEKGEAARRIAYADQKADARLDRGIREVYHQLPPSKRRAVEGR